MTAMNHKAFSIILCLTNNTYGTGLSSTNVFKTQLKQPLHCAPAPLSEARDRLAQMLWTFPATTYTDIFIIRFKVPCLYPDNSVQQNISKAQDSQKPQRNI